eukprot:6967943-Heterocapsa_arctica.AAC.1
MTAIQHGGWHSLGTCDKFRSFASHRLWQYSYDADRLQQHVQPQREPQSAMPVRHACQYLTANGTQCDAHFACLRDLQLHAYRMHDRTDKWRINVLTNECPWCRSVFTTCRGARDHAAKRQFISCEQFLRSSIPQ